MLQDAAPRRQVEEGEVNTGEQSDEKLQQLFERLLGGGKSKKWEKVDFEKRLTELALKDHFPPECWPANNAVS